MPCRHSIGEAFIHDTNKFYKNRFVCIDCLNGNSINLPNLDFLVNTVGVLTD